MMMINYNCGADLSIDSSIRLKDRRQEAPEMGTLSLSTHKSVYPNSVCLAVEQSAFFWGFVISAVCEYARDNQRNDTSGSATRTNAGSNGGRRIEPAWECVRLFSQPFEPIAQDTCKSVLAVTRDGSVERTQAERNQLILAWDELCLHSGFTIERYN